MKLETEINLVAELCLNGIHDDQECKLATRENQILVS